jgi:hypothetical protein
MSMARTDSALLSILTGSWTAIGVLLWVTFPKAAPAILLLCSVAPAAWYWAACRRLPWCAPSAVTAALVLGGIYLLINASWSLSPSAALWAIGLMLAIAAVLHIVLHTLPELDGPPLCAMALGTLAGLTLAGALLCIEVFSEQALRRLLIPLVPALQPHPLHILELDGGQVVSLRDHLPNPSIGVLALLFWPAVLMVSRLGLMRRHRYGVLLASGVAGITVFASEHASSMVAFAGAGLTFALFRVHPRAAKALMVAGWTIATLLAVPLASLPYSAGMHRASWLPESARHRVVIWRHTSEQVPNAPFLGAGASTARTLYKARSPDTPLAPGTRFQLATGMHSHNAYLQVWYEAGGLGALIVFGLGLLVLRAIGRFRVELQPFLFSTFAACALLAASAFSIWAPWYMASLAMASVFAALGAVVPADARSGTPLRSNSKLAIAANA